MLVLGSHITVGGVSFGGVHEVKVKRSIHELGATASIKVPVTAVLSYAGEPPARIEVAKTIKVGDKVSIALGYNGSLTREFVGYVKVLNLQTPLEIICEDEYYMTRGVSITFDGSKEKITLKEVLQTCGLSVAYATDLTLTNFVVDNKPISWVLGKLKTEYGLTIFFDMSGNVYAGEPYKIISDVVEYRLRYNVIKDDSLKFHRAEDVKLKIKAVCIFRDGTKVEGTIGADDGTEKTLYFYDVESKEELAALAAAELKRYSYDGYSGSIEAFLAPYAIPCMRAKIVDDIFPERNGTYYIESTEVTYGMSGGRRKLEIGIAI